MKQGVLVNHRVRLLLSDGQSCYRIRRTVNKEDKNREKEEENPFVDVL